MNYLNGYIGIKGYGTAPASGQYVNQLPGISLKSIQSIANSEQVTFVEVFNDVQERAWVRFSSDFNVKMRAKYCLKKTFDTDAVISDDKTLFKNAWWYLLGAELMYERLYSERINKITTIDRNKAEELRDLFTGLYDNALDELMPAIQYKEEQLDISQRYNRVERLP